jgi:cardiolipin synthase
MNVPNILTLSRILMTPLLMWFLLTRRMNQALVVFLIAGMTDGLDGLIARLFHQKSRFGAILDPLADKFLLVSSFLILGHIGAIPLWLVIVVVARDVLIVLGTASLFLFRFQVEIQPSSLGKLTTLTQLLAVLLAMGSSLIEVSPWNYLVFAITAILSVASGTHYVRKGVSLIQSQLFPDRTKT